MIAVMEAEPLAAQVRVRHLAVDEIDVLQPLWTALHDHHMGMTAHLEPVAPSVSGAESWSRRHKKYVQWLDEPESFALLAECDGVAVGYAMCRVVDGDPGSWSIAPRVGVLETLSIAPGERGHGLGTRMIAEVRREFDARGAEQFRLLVITTNADAIRFYERHGLRPHVMTMLATVSPSPGEAAR